MKQAAARQILVLFHAILVLKLSLGCSFHAGLTQATANATVELRTSVYSISYFWDIRVAQSLPPRTTLM